MFIEVKLEQPEKAELPIDVTESPIEIDFRLTHFLKEELYILFISSPIIHSSISFPKSFPNEIDDTMVSLLIEILLGEHPSKAFACIDVTELGIIIEVKPVQFLKAVLPIDVTELGMLIDVRLEHPKKVLSFIDVTESGMVIEVKLVQFLKAVLPIDVTEFGMLIDVRLEHPKKVLSLMDVIELGMIIEVKPEQP